MEEKEKAFEIVELLKMLEEMEYSQIRDIKNISIGFTLSSKKEVS